MMSPKVVSRSRILLSSVPQSGRRVPPNGGGATGTHVAPIRPHLECWAREALAVTTVLPFMTCLGARWAKMCTGKPPETVNGTDHGANKGGGLLLPRPSVHQARRRHETRAEGRVVFRASIDAA
jgi:hypothetical protein